MPNRPRSHILEEESRNFFRSIIPSEWLFRDESPDYGIDGSIEIFDTNDESTALRFFIQLKSTDSEEVKKQKTIRFRSSTRAYWHKQKYPTLLVLYCSANKEVYWAWHFDKRISAIQNAKTASLKFEKGDLWDSTSPDRIKTHLVAIIRFRDEPTRFPIPVKLTSCTSNEEIRIDEILRDEFQNFSDLITYGDNRPEVSPITISYSKDNLCVDFAGITSFTFPVEQTCNRILAGDTLTAIALGFSVLRKCHLVGIIVKKAYANSKLMTNPHFSVWLAQDLTQEKEFSVLRSIASHLTQREDSYAAVSPYAFMPTMQPALLSDEERATQRDFLISHIREVKTKFPISYGLASYNIGEYLLGIGDLRLAFRYFRIAAESDGHYARSSYVWSQASGILFRLHHFLPAAAGYLRTMRMDGRSNPETMALFADAQLHRGRIGSAFFWLQKAINKEQLQKDPRIHLFATQLVAINKISEILGTARHNIDRKKSEQLIACAESVSLAEALPLALTSASLNPGSSRAWSLLSRLMSSDNNRTGAQVCALIAASLSDGDPSYWMDLLISCMFETSDISAQIVTTAFTCLPQHLAEEAYFRAKNARSTKQKQFYRELGEELSKFPAMKVPRIIRMRTTQPE